MHIWRYIYQKQFFEIFSLGYLYLKNKVKDNVLEQNKNVSNFEQYPISG